MLQPHGSSIANGTVAISPWNWDLNLPGVAAAAAAYDKEYNVSFMPVESGESWAGVQQIVAAINAAKSADPSKIRDALASTTFSSGPASAMPPGKVSTQAPVPARRNRSSSSGRTASCRRSTRRHWRPPSR
jgi:ABC-type branched-subunit amino acid transport system substrate-binding protein